jgi:hypothetical protein
MIMMMIFWNNWWNEFWQGKPKYSEETCSGATLSTTKSHMTIRSRTPDRSGGKPASNRLSNDAACRLLCSNEFIAILQQNVNALKNLFKFDEAHVHLSGIVNKETYHYWADVNPMALHE